MARPPRTTGKACAAATVPDKDAVVSDDPGASNSGAADLVREAQRAAADLLVFAPIGLVKRARTLLPDLIREGRTTAATARTIGKFVTPIVRKQGTKLVRSTVTDLTRPKAGASKGGASKGGASKGGASKGGAPDDPGRADAAASSRRSSRPAASAAATHKAATPITPRLDTVEEPFPGYDHLGSAAVVARLGELSARERAMVLRYEQANRNRRTILGRVDQLDATP